VDIRAGASPAWGRIRASGSCADAAFFRVDWRSSPLLFFLPVNRATIASTIRNSRTRTKAAEG